jgi:hypothetical protein
MPYQKSDGTYVYSEGLGAAVVPSAARTTNGNGSSIETGDRVEVRGLVLDVTALSGTPTLTASVQTSDDNTNWRTLASFTAVTTSPNNQHLSVGGLDRYMRFSWTITGGTPSITFSIGALGGELI